jgi:hypothetical protein
MNGLETVGVFNLLNLDGKRMVVSNVHGLLEIVISILFFGNPSKTYLKGLLDLAREIADCIFVTDISMYPQIKRDCAFLNILERFNQLQKAEEANLHALLNRTHNVDTFATYTVVAQNANGTPMTCAPPVKLTTASVPSSSGTTSVK